MLQYFIFNPRVVVWMLWLVSQGLFIHIFFVLGHKVDYTDLEVKTLKNHAILSTFSTLGLIANGSILFRLIPVFATRNTKLAHLMVFLLALGFATWDILSLYIGVNVLVPAGHKHFYSTHSICGFLTYIVFTLMFIASLCQFFLTSQYTRRLLSGCHSFFGFALILMALFAATSGCKKVIFDVEKIEGHTARDMMFNMQLVKFEMFCYFIFVYFIILDPLFDWESIGSI